MKGLQVVRWKEGGVEVWIAESIDILTWTTNELRKQRV